MFVTVFPDMRGNGSSHEDVAINPTLLSAIEEKKHDGRLAQFEISIKSTSYRCCPAILITLHHIGKFLKQQLPIFSCTLSFNYFTLKKYI